ncbi:MAG: tetratricopeptide repeat protein [Clostridia bacterium]
MDIIYLLNDIMTIFPGIVFGVVCALLLGKHVKIGEKAGDAAFNRKLYIGLGVAVALASLVCAVIIVGNFYGTRKDSLSNEPQTTDAPYANVSSDELALKANMEYAAGNYSDALACATEGYARGNAQCANVLGHYYCDGSACAPKYEDAIRYFTEAGDNGYVRAYIDLASLYMNDYESMGMNQEDAGARCYEFAEKASQSGLPEVYYMMAICCKEGFGTDMDWKRALELCQESVELGYTDAQEELDHLKTSYQNAKNTGLRAQNCIYAGDYDEAVNAAAESALWQDPEGCYTLGLCFENGYGVDADNDAALKWYQIAAEQDHVESMMHTAKLYYYEKNDNKTASEWFIRAAEKDNYEAVYYIGEMFWFGFGVEIDKHKACEFFEVANDMCLQQAGAEYSQAVSKMDEYGYSY